MGFSRSLGNEMTLYDNEEWKRGMNANQAVEKDLLHLLVTMQTKA